METSARVRKILIFLTREGLRGPLTGWTEAPWVGWGVGEDMGSAFLDAFDVGTESVEFFVDGFVATVDVVYAVDFGGSLGDEAGEDEGGAGAEVTSHDGSGAELVDAVDFHGSAFEGDIGSHAFQLRDVHEALWENGFRNGAGS